MEDQNSYVSNLMYSVAAELAFKVCGHSSIATTHFYCEKLKFYKQLIKFVGQVPQCSRYSAAYECTYI